MSFSFFGRKSNITGLKSSRWQQYVLIGAVALGLYGLLYLMFATGDDDARQKPRLEAAKVATVHVQAAGAQVDPRDSWIGGAGAKVAEHENRLTQQEQASKELLARFATLDRDLRDKAQKAAQPPAADAAAEVSTPAPTPVPQTAPVPAATKAVNTPLAAGKPGSTPAGFPPGSPGSVTPFTTMLPPGVTLPPGAGVSPAEPAATIGHFSLGPRAAEGRPGAPAAAGGAAPVSSPATTKAARVAHSTSSFLPIGFVRATLLGGMDAPTGGQAQNNPLPVILRLDDLAVLPNHFRGNVKDCLLVGAGYGNLSSERAYVRLETLSCVRRDHRVLEIPAHGVVYGEDGKLGIRGRLVSKQGQMLANALLSGVISGIGQGIQYQNSTTTLTPVGGVVQTANPGDGYRMGLAGGVGRALDRLANYYITLAEKTFPVVEIDSARQVDVAFTKGSELDVPLPSVTESDSEEDANDND